MLPRIYYGAFDQGYYGRGHCRYRCPTPCHSLWYCQWRKPRSWSHNRYHRGLYCLVFGREFRTDRGTNRCFYRYCLRHYPATRHRRTCRCHPHSRAYPHPCGRIAAGECDSLHPLSHYNRLHERYCRYHIHDPDKRPIRADNGGSPRRLHRQVGCLLRELWHPRLGYGSHRNCHGGSGLPLPQDL